MSLDHSPPLPRPQKRPRQAPSPMVKPHCFQLVNAQKRLLPFAPRNTLCFTAGDFTGDKKLELLFLTPGEIYVYSNEGTLIAQAKGPVQGNAAPLRVVTHRERGRPHESFFVAWGRHTIARQGTISLWRYTLTGKKIKATNLYSPKSKRHDVQDLRVDSAGTLLFAFFTSKYEVEVRRFPPPYNSAPTLVQRANMISQVAFYKAGSTLIGRIYGDTPGSDGELYRLTKGVKSPPFPTQGGVRALLTPRVKAGSTNPILAYVGDGWNKNYGKKARAYLAAITSKGGKLQRRLLDTLPMDFALFSLAQGDLDGDKKLEIVGKGNNTLAMWRPNEKYKRHVLAYLSGYDPIVLRDVDGDGRDEILLSKPSPMLLSLRTPQ